MRCDAILFDAIGCEVVFGMVVIYMYLSHVALRISRKSQVKSKIRITNSFREPNQIDKFTGLTMVVLTRKLHVVRERFNKCKAEWDDNVCGANVGGGACALVLTCTYCS